MSMYHHQKTESLCLAPADQITIHVFGARGPTTIRATIDKYIGHTPHGGVAAFRWRTDWENGEVFSNDEGTKWIHGWLDESSDEVLALMAAAALLNDAPMPFAVGDGVSLGTDGKLVGVSAPQYGPLGKVVACHADSVTIETKHGRITMGLK